MNVTLGQAVRLGCILCFLGMPFGICRLTAAPVPLEVAASPNALVGGLGRAGAIAVSPDGEWVVYHYKPFAEAEHGTGSVLAGLEACVTNSRTGESFRLGAQDAVPATVAWSRDGRRLVFVSTRDKQRRFVILDLETRKYTAIPEVEPASTSSYERIQWTPDGRQILCRVKSRTSDPVEPVKVSSTEKRPIRVLSTINKTVEQARQEVVSTSNKADLALVDVASGHSSILVEQMQIHWYSFSPDGRYVAYSEAKGTIAGTWQGLYNLVSCRLEDRGIRYLAENVAMNAGLEVSWSPTSQQLAAIESGSLATSHPQSGRIMLFSPEGGRLPFEPKDVPSFNNGTFRPPLWNNEGTAIFVTSTEGELWRVGTDQQAALIASFPGRRIHCVIPNMTGNLAWQAPGKQSLWLLVQDVAGPNAGIAELRLEDGSTRLVDDRPRSFQRLGGTYVGAGKGFYFFSEDQQHPAAVFAFDASSGSVSPVSNLNPQISDYPLGQARLVKWRDLSGRVLQGTLLLPPDYAPGRPVPFVVEVYATRLGSRMINDFGMHGSAVPVFNMHVLASRGYAVFEPDLPIREGRFAEDILNATMTGVNAMIDQGFADEKRMAVMGHSLGSYCVMSLLTQTQRFLAAIISGAVIPPDIFPQYLYLDQEKDAFRNTGYWERHLPNFGGTPWEKPEVWRRNMAVFRFDEITTPLLIGQGTKDLVPTAVSSDLIYSALKRLSKPVEYRLYEGEGHTITERPNAIDFWQRRIEFLDEYLDVKRDDQGNMVMEGDHAKSRRAISQTTPK